MEEEKMQIRFILKNGCEFIVKCSKFSLEKNGFGDITSYSIDGIAENKPLYLDISQIAAIVRI